MRITTFSPPHRVTFLLLITMLSGFLLIGSASAAEPVKIGVIAPAAHIAGRAIFQGAKLAADEINKDGGIDGRQIKLFEYDNKGSATDSVRAFQRAVQQDGIQTMTGVFLSEVALALAPWSARLQTPLIVTGAASTEISERVHENYDQYKYIFHGYNNSVFLAEAVCDSSKALLVDKLGYKTAVILSEEAAWTKPVDQVYNKCLPEAGLEVVDHIRFSPETQDFSPIFNRIEKSKADVIMSAIAHVGVAPTVQWRQKEVPAFLAGISGQAGSTSFWNNTNKATEGVITISAGAAGAALSPSTPAFYKNYMARFKEEPAYDAYTTYDAIYTLKAAIESADSDDADDLVAALEKTDIDGVQGHLQFYGKDDPYTHGLKYGPDNVTGVAFQWQSDGKGGGKQVVLWPEKVANGEIQVPDFVKAGANKN